MTINTYFYSGSNESSSIVTMLSIMILYRGFHQRATVDSEQILILKWNTKTISMKKDWYTIAHSGKGQAEVDQKPTQSQ